MNYLENVYVFAKSWLEKFRVNTNQFKLFLSDNFYDECDMLGFRMDNAEFFTKYGFADSDYLELAKIIEKVSDIQLLGSAIFARWHYFKSSTDEAAILKIENRIWFVLALGRLADLTKKKPNAFPQGIKQMRLTTNLISFGMRPNEGDEIEQQLMIDENGNVTFTGYNYHRSAIDYEKGRSKSEKIAADKAQNLLKVVSNYFFNQYTVKDVTDTGYWRLEMLGTDEIQLIILKDR
ncbi:hypothetical protein PT285_07730 [Lactobacillus sp. ESL0791]|uniref:hypothetical protein n=1 Tax=Lactobacillus sp. ESL0791 TaxID=2983234 RepID=UPI0023F62939|nr:hypothetical protein [Lactobacillus sp. ESL0791]MDF7639289.1 hypothetical protein [Lactobacillus sp. ESL0791]